MGKKKGKFLLGAVVGCVAGLLFAPKVGSETRRELKKKFNELTEKVKEIDKEELRDKVECMIAELKNDLNDLNKEKAIELAKEKYEIVKGKAEELYELALKKGTPVLKDTALQVKDKAIKVAIETLQKLEKEGK